MEPQALSAVYLAFEPEEDRRALGVFNVLWLIGECQPPRRAPPLPRVLRAGVARDELQGFLSAVRDARWTALASVSVRGAGAVDSL